MMDVRRLKPAGAEKALSTFGHGFGDNITRFIRRKEDHVVIEELYKHNLNQGCQLLGLILSFNITFL